MKSLKIMVLFFMVSAFFLTGFVQASEKIGSKIGYVDLSRLFDEYYKTKQYDKILEQKHNEFTKKEQEKMDKIKEAQGKLAIMNDDQKAELEKQIDKMKQDLMEFDRQQKTNLTKERNEKIREILLEIEKVVSNFAKANGYSIILNDRVLIYGAQNLDLTEQVLKILNEGEKKSK